MGIGEIRQIRHSLAHANDRKELLTALQRCAAAAASGNSEAVEILLTATVEQQLLRPAIRRQLFDPDDQDDVEQDALMNVSRSIGSFRSDANVMSWMHTVATNSAINFLRKQKQLTESQKADLADRSVRFTSISANRDLVRNIINQLPEPHRTALKLRDLDGLAYKEIATRTQTNLNTVRGRIARARALAVDLLDQTPSSDTLRSAGD